MKRECGNCDFYNEIRHRGGECRVEGPKLLMDGSGRSGWPPTGRNEWCGRFVAKNSTATQVVVGQPYYEELSHGV